MTHLSQNDSDPRTARIRQVANDCLQRWARGETFSDQEVFEHHPDLMPELSDELNKLRLLDRARQQAKHDDDRPAPDRSTEESTGSALRETGQPSQEGTSGGNTMPTELLQAALRDAAAAPAELPRQISRYRVVRLLGQGGFGNVYLAYDDQLQRSVAVKVPHADRAPRTAEIESFQAEARILANLDHPAIVPVFDAGQTDDGKCFVVSKYMEGSDLQMRILQGQLPYSDTAALIAKVAEALHVAHVHGLVHRDVKPANILLDADGQPFLADFGVALREEDFGRGSGMAGTPAYMSPEQARGEGHLVDGRSDIFSLGVVFYELLAGRRPFCGANWNVISERIQTLDPRPLRQINDTIPRQLERICLKALSKRATDRYTTALDMAEDLKAYLAGEFELASPLDGPEVSKAASAPALPPTMIVPRGLRAYDAEDAEFFLQLLPGPRNRDGLPESIQFWKKRIEQSAAESGFRVGVMYGPSGCGKSSLLKAGLIPRLSPEVLPILIEATSDDVRPRLLRRLHDLFPDLPSGITLPEALKCLRLGDVRTSGKKVVVFIDQFEQWLHGQSTDQPTELSEALRHCDGRRLSCLLMIRDDFWLAINRFMRQLEIPILEGKNSGLVDLFDPSHARKVLSAIGQAYGSIPTPPAELTRPQEQFLDLAVAELAEDGKISPVRLALFAEVVKSRPWTPKALKTVGGVEGVAVAFLNETFSAPTAPLENRLHQRAARAVLEALLPEKADVIRGRTLTAGELRKVAGYSDRPEDFEHLLQVLDTETRLLTPVDLHEQFRPDGHDSTSADAGRRYQLSHDYLVPALRTWLWQKKKETFSGRAQLRLAERTALWSANPEQKQLPSLWESLSIWLFSRRTQWSPDEKQLMQQATRYYLSRGLILLAVIGICTVLLVTSYRRSRAIQLVNSLKTTRTSEVPNLAQSLARYQRWAEPQLRMLQRDSPAGSKEQLHYQIALLPFDSAQADPLCQRMLTADATEFDVLRELLAPHRSSLSEFLWQSLDSPDAPPSQRFRAACALATLDTPDSAEDSQRWQQVAPFVVEQLLREVSQQPSDYRVWSNALRGVHKHLLRPLQTHFGPPDRSVLATKLLADYAHSDSALLVSLLQDATDQQFDIFLEPLAHHSESVTLLKDALQLELHALPTDEEKEQLAKRQANAAVALLKWGQTSLVWPLLQNGEDPRLRNYLIDRISRLGADPSILAEQLRQESNASIRQGTILALGGFRPEQLPNPLRKQTIQWLVNAWREEQDAGVHAAADWLLRSWNQEKQLAQVRTDNSQEHLVPGRGWYLDPEGHTIVLLGPAEFEMGRQPSEPARFAFEDLHRRRIGRRFGIGSTEVTVEQFRTYYRDRFGQPYEYDDRFTPDDRCPIPVTWYQAAAYCNWLSERAGIPRDQWCYQPNEQGEFAAGMRPTPDHLQRSGYRLPTEAEWEYACRAGSKTSRFFGQSDELLDQFAWFDQNSNDASSPVGLLKPNPFGLFDILGNVWEWCDNRFTRYPRDADVVADTADSAMVKDDEKRISRGGNFANPALYARAATRNQDPPTHLHANWGFRVARTITSGSPTAANGPGLRGVSFWRGRRSSAPRQGSD